jgi:hypothetical protein
MKTSRSLAAICLVSSVLLVPGIAGAADLSFAEQTSRTKQGI